MVPAKDKRIARTTATSRIHAVEKRNPAQTQRRREHSAAQPQPKSFGLRRESRRAGATPLWKVCPQSKSGIAATFQSSLRFASAGCHRSPKSSDGNFFVETITPIEHNHCAGYGNGKRISVESTKPDSGAFASRSGRVAAPIRPDSGSAGNRRGPAPGRKHTREISA